MFDKLGQSQFNTVTDIPLRNAGLTPLEGTLLSAKQYFSDPGYLSNAEGGAQSALPESCEKDFIVLVTDGLPSTDANGNSVASPEVGIGATAAAALKSIGVDTYVVGFALPPRVSGDLLDLIATAGGTGESYLAGDPEALSQSLADIFSNIGDKTGSAASLSFNGETLVAGSHVYQSSFDATDWSGDLQALNISSSGDLDGDNPVWSASTQLELQNWDSGREILSWNGSGGVSFRWGALSADQKAYLNDDPDTVILDDDGKGSARLNYVRGGRSNEGGGYGFRSRSKVLGGLIHSPSVKNEKSVEYWS